MPAYEWTCKECDAKVRGWSSYHPHDVRQPCKKFIAKSPDDPFSPTLFSSYCQFKDPKMIDTDGL